MERGRCDPACWDNGCLSMWSQKNDKLSGNWRESSSETSSNWSGGAGEKVMVHEVRVDLCQRKKKQIPSTHQEVLRVTKQDLNMHFLMYSLCWKIKATLPNSKYVIMFIHFLKKLYMQLLTGSWGTFLDGNWISIDMGTDKESSMVLMNFSMRNLYHIGSECYGSHSILISVACPLKTSWSPIECHLCFVIQTKPIKISNWNGLSVFFFFIFLIIPFSCFPLIL